MYAIELLDNVNDEELQAPYLKSVLLNGALSWRDFSYDGCSLIYDQDIAQRLCTKSELKKTRNGELKPNHTEDWLDTQARALCQAYNLIIEYRNGD